MAFQRFYFLIKRNAVKILLLLCSFPAWQDCHEMWCKKRRRKGDNRNAEDSARGAKRESLTSSGLATNPEASVPSLPQASDVKPSVSNVSGSSVASTVDSHLNINSVQFPDLKQGESFYGDRSYHKIEKQGFSQTSYEQVKNDNTSCNRVLPNSKSSHSQDKVYSIQATTRGNYQLSSKDQGGLGKCYEQRNFYSRDSAATEKLKIPAGFKDSSVFY